MKKPKTISEIVQFELALSKLCSDHGLVLEDIGKSALVKILGPGESRFARWGCIISEQ